MVKKKRGCREIERLWPRKKMKIRVNNNIRLSKLPEYWQLYSRRKINLICIIKIEALKGRIYAMSGGGGLLVGSILMIEC